MPLGALSHACDRGIAILSAADLGLDERLCGARQCRALYLNNALVRENQLEC
jgi:hypothetical protein